MLQSDFVTLYWYCLLAWMGFPIETNWVHLLTTRLRCWHLNPSWVRVVCLIFESARVSEDMCVSESHCNYVHTRCWGEKNLSRAPSHLPIAVWTGNAVQWGHTLGISALQLCCPVLLHSCERVCTLVGKAKVFYKRIGYCCSLLCSRALPSRFKSPPWDMTTRLIHGQQWQ